MNLKKILNAAVVFLLATATIRAWDTMPYPGHDISRTVAKASGDQIVIGNNTLAATFQRIGGSLRLARLQAPLNHLDLNWTDTNLFSLHLTGVARPLASSAMKLLHDPELVALSGNPLAARLSERLPGKAVRAVFADEGVGLRVEWTAVMKDGANYLQQEIRLTATHGPVAIDSIEMIHAALPGAKVDGYTDGAPIVTGQLFLGVEHPMAYNNLLSPDNWTPAEMQARAFDVPVANLSGGILQARFDYQHGNHRIDITKVSLLSAGGNVLCEDVHDGFSGNSAGSNVYRLPIPAGTTAGTLHVTLGGVAGDTDSWGKITVTGGQIVPSSTVACSLPRRSSLVPGGEWTVADSIGVFPPGQLRRAFLYYLERERAHPYRQYWHYNSWFDLGIGRNDNPDPLHRMNEQQCLDVIGAFNRELYQKRGVGLNGYVWDDGWDDWNSLWQFHKGFPNGFTKLKDAAAVQGAGLGAWLSPWGGYGGSHDMRVKFGAAKGYETNANGFSLGGAKYFAAFRDTCVKMIRDYNMNYFKFDGIGGGMFATGAPVSIAPDLDSLIRLIGGLRKANPDVFINCTVGTWASPYWTFFADSIWRQGEDCSFSGKGNARERWINYKDSIVYDRFVSRSPLFPVNSLMYHGVVLGPTFNPGSMPPPAKDLAGFQHEVRMAAGYSSGLGELYITPALMTPDAWDCLAESIRWARAKQAVMVDSHWIGGDPRQNAIYGFAAWHPVKGGVITLRNPDDKPQTISIKLAEVFELPPGAGTHFELRSPWKSDPSGMLIKADAERPAEITLQPFEVITLETQP